MIRFFVRLGDGECPRLVDLPTGAGKTDVVVVWVLALAWYGLDTATRRPVPRRMIWVVNRRVLVQQVFNLVDMLQQELSAGGHNPLADVRDGLSRLSGDSSDIFRVAQLRGQLVDDREWSVAPTVPQLVVGTVDQIGSRLLFQGYSLGKWSRPMQAALLGIDAWICVDEAHLVPAFVLTLRQVLRFIAGAPGSEILAPVFERLPFWLTELSATPGLPYPSREKVFCREPSDEDDPQLKDRLLAARIRRVNIQWVRAEDKPEDEILKTALDLEDQSGAIAVFVKTPRVANGIAKALEKKFKGRVLAITGRLRGYERDRLEKQEVFQRFRSAGDNGRPAEAGSTVFLVGTAAAEVGLDADAESIYCDFASLTTLIQRLGRLDRRGRLSRRAEAGECPPPTMTVFAKPEGNNAEIHRRILKLARSLRNANDDLSPLLLVGNHWRLAVAKTAEPQGDTEPEVPDNENTQKSKQLEPGELVSAATRAALLGRRSGGAAPTTVATPPSSWLKRPIARVTAGPVAVPPLTRAVIEQWAATTNPRSAFLPVHPFLYGILPEEEGAPLISVAFRLEMDVVMKVTGDPDEDELEGQPIRERVLAIFRRFAPRRAEFHFVPLSDARDWLSSTDYPIAHFDGEEWIVSRDREKRPFLQPGGLIVLPTLAVNCEFLDDAKDPAMRDVLDGVSATSSPYLRRITQIEAGDYRIDSKDGASRFLPVERPETIESLTGSHSDFDQGEWKCHTRQLFEVGSATFRFDYYKPKRQTSGRLLLDEHLERAAREAARISEVLAPGNQFLRALLVESAKVHDIGKHNPRWQWAMGNRALENPVAKPVVDNPRSTGGFRHEWQSLLEMRHRSPAIPDSLSEADSELWLDLWYHLVASHHGHLRPWLWESVLEAHALGKAQQSDLRLQSADRFVRLQRATGSWRLAYVEALLKASDVTASQVLEQEESDEQ